MLYVANVTCWRTERQVPQRAQVADVYICYIRNYPLTLQCSGTSKWSNFKVYTHSRRLEKMAAEPWRRLEKSRNRSTDSYAVHCPDVATKVLTIVFDRLWLSPTRMHKPQRYHLWRGWQDKDLVLLLLLLLLRTPHKPAVRTTAKDSRLPLSQ